METTMSDELNSTTMDTPVGVLTLVASAQGLRLVLWEGEDADRVAGDTTDADPEAKEVLERAVEQLEEYFAGERTEFDLPLDPKGTDFQLQVWQVLRTIPYGQTISYGEQARRLGDVNKSRAVGAANGRNPLSIIVPCHRVIGADGSLTGFGGGLENKAWLLDHERGISGLGL
jgi:methylated-DNA-[protein]-cysteine S-methyltransferase